MQSMKRQLDRLLYVFTFCCETIHHEKQKTLVGGWWVGMRFEGEVNNNYKSPRAKMNITFQISLPLARNFITSSVPWLTMFAGGYWTTSGSGPSRVWIEWQWPMDLANFLSLGLCDTLRVLRRFSWGKPFSGRSLRQFQLWGQILKIFIVGIQKPDT